MRKENFLWRLFSLVLDYEAPQGGCVPCLQLGSCELRYIQLVTSNQDYISSQTEKRETNAWIAAIREHYFTKEQLVSSFDKSISIRQVLDNGGWPHSIFHNLRGSLNVNLVNSVEDLYSLSSVKLVAGNLITHDQALVEELSRKQYVNLIEGSLQNGEDLVLSRSMCAVVHKLDHDAEIQNQYSELLLSRIARLSISYDTCWIVTKMNADSLT
jgi:hypothetical protein